MTEKIDLFLIILVLLALVSAFFFWQTIALPKEENESSPEEGIDWDKLWATEHELMHQRLTWLGVAQSLLLTAFILSTRFDVGIDPTIAWLGLLTTGAVFVGICGAIKAQSIIGQERGGRLTWGISKPTTIMGWVPAVGIPLVFLGAWIFLLWAFPSDIREPGSSNYFEFKMELQLPR